MHDGVVTEVDRCQAHVGEQVNVPGLRLMQVKCPPQGLRRGPHLSLEQVLLACDQRTAALEPDRGVVGQRGQKGGRINSQARSGGECRQGGAQHRHLQRPGPVGWSDILRGPQDDRLTGFRGADVPFQPRSEPVDVGTQDRVACIPPCVLGKYVRPARLPAEPGAHRRILQPPGAGLGFGGEFGGALPRRAGSLVAAPALRAPGDGVEVGRHAIVKALRGQGQMPRPPIKITGKALREDPMYPLLLNQGRRPINGRAHERVPKPQLRTPDPDQPGSFGHF